MQYIANNLKNTEKRLKHKLVLKEDPYKEEFPMNYPVPDFGVDQDVKNTKSSIDLA